jgi:hypothetical protein
VRGCDHAESERHDDERATCVAEPPRAPDRREGSKADDAAQQGRECPDRRAHHRRRRNRQQQAGQAVEPGEWIPGSRGSPQEIRGEDDLEHVADRLAERRPERELHVVVGEKVAQQDSGPEDEASEIEVGDADTDGQPDDRRHRPREPEREAELRRAVVERRQESDLARIAERKPALLETLQSARRSLAGGCDLGHRDRHLTASMPIWGLEIQFDDFHRLPHHLGIRWDGHIL